MKFTSTINRDIVYHNNIEGMNSFIQQQLTADHYYVLKIITVTQ